MEVQGAKNLGSFKGYVDNILREFPLCFSSLERNLLLMNEVAGYQIRTRLKPGTKRGGVFGCWALPASKLLAFLK